MFVPEPQSEPQTRPRTPRPHRAKRRKKPGPAAPPVPPDCRNLVRWMELVAKLREFWELLDEIADDGVLDHADTCGIRSAVDEVRQELMAVIPIEW